jgi:hypothetical protein
VRENLLSSWIAMKTHLENLLEKIDVETFIRRTHQILEEVKRNPTSLAKAQVEVRTLLMQFEGFLKSKGLES